MTDAVVVGSGPNGLAAALVLARAGVTVRVIEGGPALGGGLQSAELTLPGLIHDECAGFHPFAVASRLAREIDLVEAGLRWRRAPVELAHPLSDGWGAALRRGIAATAHDLGHDSRLWLDAFAFLTEHFNEASDEFLRPVAHLPDHPVALARFGVLAARSATAVASRWSTEAARALFTGTAAHAFVDLGRPFTSAVGVALTIAGQANGWPVAEGGSRAILAAMLRLAEGLPVSFETGRLIGSLEELGHPDLVLLDTSPRDALNILGRRLPHRVTRSYRRYRHGPAAYSVALAVADGIPWRYAPARQAATVHVGGTLEEVVSAERTVLAGRLPPRPFVLVGQQHVADPSRSRDGIHPIDAYAHVPAHFAGDATQVIIDAIERYAPGFRERVVSMRARPPAELAAAQRNAVGGDIAGGLLDLRQLLFRPRPSLTPYATGIPGVFLCSASTPPGAGAHGMCGYWAAQAALSHLHRR